MRYDDLEFEGTEFSFFYYTAGENYNVYNLVSLVRKDKVLYSFNPRLDYLFLIQNSLTAERRLNLIQSIRAAEGIVHAFAQQDKPKEPKVKTVIQEKVVKQYEVAPIEVFVKTKAPIEEGQVQNIRINGVDVPNVPVISERPAKPVAKPAQSKKFLKLGVPVILDMEDEVSPGEVRAISNWGN